VLLPHSRRAFVERLDFVTSVGHRVNGRRRADMGWIGKGPTVVITDLGVLRPSPQDAELELVALHPGVALEDVREATGWDLRVRDPLATTEPPTVEEIDALRRLRARES
jgi:glutaconate CoA-transferase, subunit B